MGFLEDLLGGKISTEDKLGRGFDFQLMAAQRMAKGFEPIDWETILRNERQAAKVGCWPPGTHIDEQGRRVKHVESRDVTSAALRPLRLQRRK